MKLVLTTVIPLLADFEPTCVSSVSSAIAFHLFSVVTNIYMETLTRHVN